MLILSIGLLVLGVITAVSGLKLFRALLPILGFVSGVMVGYGGVQGVFGRGAISTTIAIIMAVIVGTIMAILSFMFFEVAVLVLATILGASVFSYLAVALSLGDNGFLLFILTVAGGILGFVVASSGPLSRDLVIVITSMLGVTFILASIMLMVGSVTLNQLQYAGIVPTVMRVVNQEFLWLLVWLGGSLVATMLQSTTADYDMLSNSYEFKEVK